MHLLKSHFATIAVGPMLPCVHQREQRSSLECTPPASADITCVAESDYQRTSILTPEILRKAGYYCTNNSKKDYNFATEDGGWNDSGRKAHWRNRPGKDTPFFSIFNFTVSHESKIRTRPHQLKHDPAEAPLPAYHPDTPEVRHDWAQYYDKMTEMDQQVGELLAELKVDGLNESTIIFYYGDHGSGMPRSKRWPFDSGLRVPLLLHVPAKFRQLAPADYGSGKVTDRLVSFVDLGPTAISLAGLKPPTDMQGIPFAGEYNGGSKEISFRLPGTHGRTDLTWSAHAPTADSST